MNYSSAKFSNPNCELARFAKAIALPIRVTILRAMLKERDWLCAQSFISIPFTLAYIENNLLGLKRSGLLEMKYVDRIPYYRLNEEYFRLYSQRFANLLNLSCTVYLPENDIIRNEIQCLQIIAPQWQNVKNLASLTGI